MGRIKRIVMSILLFFIFFIGTVPVSANAQALHMVTQVQVVCKRECGTIIRTYVQPHKVSAILNYLRLLDCGGTADRDPERLLGDSYDITLYYSDGEHRIYRQRADRFLSKNAQPWLKIDPQQGSQLHPLLQSMVSDTDSKKDLLQK